MKVLFFLYFELLMCEAPGFENSEQEIPPPRTVPTALDFAAIRKYLPEPPTGLAPATAEDDYDSDERIRYHSWTTAFAGSGIEDPAYQYISSVDRASIAAHVECAKDGSQGRTIYILPGLATSESPTGRDVFGPASSVALVHTVTQRVLHANGTYHRETTCSCEIFCFLNSIRNTLPEGALRRFCPHCVLVNLIEDDRESVGSGNRESFRAVYPLLAK
jgi:hypothetical protein